MANPPVFVRGGNTSAVNASNVNGVTTHNAQNAAFDHRGSIFVAETLGGGRAHFKARHITQSTGIRSAGLAPLRMRFLTDAPRIDFCFQEGQFALVNAVVDGQLVSRGKPFTIGNSGNYRYHMLDFGANATTFEKAQVGWNIVAGGTGHVVGDVVTLNGGTGGASGTPCSVLVTQVVSGAVSSCDVVALGSYATQPSGTFSQTASTGVGTGLQLTASFFGKVHSTRAMRKLELIYSQPTECVGIVVDSASTVLACGNDFDGPRLCVVGDSINIGTYLRSGGQHIGSSIAQHLGMWDDHIISGIGGSGWNTANAITRWSSPERVQDLIDCNADIYLWIGSQNDTAGAALTAAVTATLNAVAAARPQSLHVGIGNVLGASTAVAASIEAGFAAASASSRTRFINNQSPTSWVSSAALSEWFVTGDGNHLSQSGQDYFSKISAHRVAAALLDLIFRR
jgi:hypothetical protein